MKKSFFILLLASATIPILSSQENNSFNENGLEELFSYLDNLAYDASELQKKAEAKGLADSHTDEMIELDNRISEAIRSYKNGRYGDAENQFESSLNLANQLLSFSETNITTEPDKKIEYIKYTVCPGDTLWNIASSRMESSFFWPLLWDANKENITNPDFITPGTILLIPAK